MSQQEIAARKFDVVNQLNLGSQLIVDREEQQRTAALNLQAAKKAKASTAYGSACRYLAAAMATLGQQGWRDCYELTFSVWLERADCEFLASNMEEAAHWIEELLLRADKGRPRPSLSAPIGPPARPRRQCVGDPNRAGMFADVWY